MLLNYGFWLAISLILLLFVCLFFIKYKALIKENKRLKKTNEQKDKFFSIIAHDLKDPVLSFRGLIDKINFLLERKQFEVVNTLGNEVDLAVNQIEITLHNLVLWGKLQSNTFPNTPELIQLEAFFKKSFKEEYQIAEAKAIIIQKEIELDAKVMVDRRAFEIILKNILNNAIKYSDKGGIIQMQAKDSEIRIIDNGVGIPEQKLSTIFEYDKRKKSPGTRGERGAGFGLALVQSLVHLNNGTIEIESERGNGTKVILKFSDPHE